MIFRRANGGCLRISDSAVAAMHAHRQLLSDAPEAGGILLGRLILNANDAVIDRATVPTPHDRQSRFRFFRSKRSANAMIDDAWRASNATTNYLGEWHTHPEDTPCPSCVDVRNWRRIHKRSKIEQDFLFFIIVGRAELRIWELARDERTPIMLQAIESVGS